MYYTVNVTVTYGRVVILLVFSLKKHVNLPVKIHFIFTRFFTSKKQVKIPLKIPTNY